MSRTFELSNDGRQLYETLHMTTGRINSPLAIRFVYDIPRRRKRSRSTRYDLRSGARGLDRSFSPSHNPWN